MKVLFSQKDSKGIFYIEEENKRMAVMEFTMAGSDKLIIDHTDVDDRLRGQGAGKKLLDRLIEYVRKNNIKVIPLCPFAKSVFEKDVAIRDVLLY